MALILSKFRRLAAAIGIGLLVETLLFAGTVLLTDRALHSGESHAHF
jgi:hypothetical protein